MKDTYPEIYSAAEYMDHIVDWGIKNRTTTFEKKQLPAPLQCSWHRRAISLGFLRKLSTDKISKVATWKIAGKYGPKVKY